MDEILERLSKPFHPSAITWKPGVLKKDKTGALGLAYADLRAYQNRLDEVCGMNWSVSYTPWGDRIVCHITINDITRSSTGEGDAQSEKSEIAGTAAEAQAFKRACAMFGLGRYLYNLPSIWADYDEKKRTWTAQGKAKLDGIIVQHYKRNGEPEGKVTTEATAATPEPPSEPETERVVNHELVNELNELGDEVYGEQWAQVCRHNVERISEGQAQTLGQLSDESLKKLISGLKKLKRQRNGAAAAPKA